MELTDKDIIKIADLAKIHLEQNDIEKYKLELKQIFNMIEKLQEVKIDENIKIYNFVNQNLTSRKDQASEKNIVDLVLSNAPKQEYECFAVPKVRE